MRRIREIKEAERPGNTTEPVKFSEEAMKKFDALFAEPPKEEDKKDALGTLNRKIRGQELVAGAMANQISKAVEMFAAAKDLRKSMLSKNNHP